MDKQQLIKWADEEDEMLRSLARDIWENPELGLLEERTATTLIETLEREGGFDIEKGIGGMPTAFVATYGSGDPKIGILGEFDALPGLSQKVEAERSPVEEGAPGHGCGHNLYGVGSLGGAIVVKRAIEEGLIDGTIRYYGCPSEEDLVGKVYMARDGVFDDLDAALDWHPGELTTPVSQTSLVVNNLLFTFNGREAHGAAAPEKGRSTLDAAQLMNMGIEFLREHVPDGERINYSIIGNNPAPNVVPDETKVWMLARMPDKEDLDEVRERIYAIAEGAAMMTQTEVDIEFLTGCYNLLPNSRINNVIHQNMTEVGPIEFSDEERAFAGELKETTEDPTPRYGDYMPEGSEEANIYSEILEPIGEDELMPGGTDVGDVSWITPTGRFTATTWPVGVSPHTWQAVAANGSFALKTPTFVAKVMAGTAYDLMQDQTIIEEATDEFEKAKGEREYENQLPADAEPPFKLRELTSK